MPIDPHLLLLFFGSALLLAIAPGPDNLFVMAQSAQHGRQAGLMVTLGLCTGLLIHTSAVSLGLAAVFQTSRFAFTLLKVIGAAYLLYLAVQAFRASAQTAAGGALQAQPLLSLYRRGIIMNVTNPKVSIFFLAFLPQFTRPEAGQLTLQLLLLGGLFIVATIVIFGSISLIAGGISSAFSRSSKAQLWINRSAGTLFCCLALKLALGS